MSVEDWLKDSEKKLDHWCQNGVRRGQRTVIKPLEEVS